MASNVYWLVCRLVTLLQPTLVFSFFQVDRCYLYEGRWAVELTVWKCIVVSTQPSDPSRWICTVCSGKVDHWGVCCVWSLQFPALFISISQTFSAKHPCFGFLLFVVYNSFHLHNCSLRVNYRRPIDMFLHRRQHGWHLDDCFQLRPKSFRPQKKIHPHIGGSASPKNLSMVVVPIQKTCYLHRRCPSFRQIFLVGKPTFEHFQGFLRRSLDRLGANDDTGRVQHQPLSPCSLRSTVCPNNRPSRLLCVSKGIDIG